MDKPGRIKSILILESLKFNAAQDELQVPAAVAQKLTNKCELTKKCDNTRLEHNIGVIREFLKLEPQQIVDEIIKELHLQSKWEDQCSLNAVQNEESSKNCCCLGLDLLSFKNSCKQFCDFRQEHANDLEALETAYNIHMQCLLMKIIAEIHSLSKDGKEDTISMRQMNNCIKAVQDLAFYALRRQLHMSFYESALFVDARRARPEPPNYALLFLSVQSFEAALSVRQFHAANAMELVLRDYVAAIFTLHAANITKEWSLDQRMQMRLSNNLSALWSGRKKIQYFQNIMLLKSIPRLPVQLQRVLHLELVGKLHAHEGFKTLVATLTNARSGQNDDNVGGKATLNDKQVFELIANIAAFRGYSKDLHNTLITQIFDFLEECLRHEAMLEYMGAGLLALRRLYDKCDANKMQISQALNNILNTFIQPKDLLTGLIVKEYNEFAMIIALLHEIFCISTVECLPSELLVPYLPLLLQMYHHIPENFLQKRQIAALVTRCLHNRTAKDLENIIEKLYTHHFAETWHELHPRVVIFPNEEYTQLTVKITACETKNDYSISLSLPELLMNTEYHILTNRVFMALLKLMSSILGDISIRRDEDQVALLQSEEELIAFLNSKYPVKVDILLSLSTLISYQPLKSQISENSTEFLQFLRTLLEQRLNKDATDVEQSTEAMDQTLLILLTLMQELIEQTQIPEAFRDFLPTLRKLQTQTPNLLIKQRISSLNTLLSGDFKANAAQQSTEFNTARSLVESSESHLQVYGIQMLVDLLRRRDSVTLSNAHLLIALALSTLKDKESYTFLNCVRLFVALVHVMEAEVLETLADEYLSEHAGVDYRLVVGETILKVGQELGPLSYKYKDALLNCFMVGARSSIDEFRMSSYVNLAQITRILCFQVYSFFQEMLQLIDSELATGKYLPAKRAAVMVLSELLEGMDNLLDFEEMLLPIYRLLKLLEADENEDEKMRQHAANGLKALAEKCNKFMFPTPRMEKEIRIFGVKESKPNGGKHILELN